MTLLEFLRNQNTPFINCRKSEKSDYDLIECAPAKGAKATAVLYISAAMRSHGDVPTNNTVKDYLNYEVYNTVTKSGVSGYTLGYPGREFRVEEGTEIEL